MGASRPKESPEEAGAAGSAGADEMPESLFLFNGFSRKMAEIRVFRAKIGFGKRVSDD
jgi:hypothetical protein